MKLKIEADFYDRITGELHKAGAVAEFDEDRAAELLADKRGLVSKAPDPKKTPAKKPAKKK